MEEVWKDINLASLNEQTTRPITTRSNLEGVIFQDFLARPFNIEPPNSMLSSSASSESSSLYCPAPSSSLSPTPTPPLVTALSLNSRPDFHFDTLTPKISLPHHPEPSKLSCFNNPSPTPLESFVCTSSLTCLGTKRFVQPPPDNTLGDRRNKRMIKNRESAARSRARKQAYTNELELKVEHLKEENARLRRQQQQLCEVAASQPKKKGTLYRTSTAPF